MKTFIRTSLGLGLLALILAACNISPTPGERPQIRAMEDPQVEENFAYIPNADEATVSKVNLVDPPEAVARYKTVPDGEQDADPIDWRVSRLALDADGNAWVLNSATGQDAGSLQGSVVRIAAEGEDGETTSQDHDDILAFADEDRTTLFEVGGVSDMPRTINIAADGTIWIGFYAGNYFQEFTYDEDANELSAGATINVGDFTPYLAALADDGTMYVSSRNASPFGSGGVPAVFSFDTDDLGAGTTNLDYSVPAGNANPYAIIIASDGTVWVSDAGRWNQDADRYLSQWDGDDWTHFNVGGAAHRGLMEDLDGNIWVADTSGDVIKLDPDSGDSERYNVSVGEALGLGMDAFGNIWVVDHANDEIVRLSGTGDVTRDVAVGVGMGPYAYGDFVTLVETGTIDGYKAITEELAAHLDDLEVDEPLAGWEIKLHEDLAEKPIETTLTDDEGYFIFEDLDPGTYWVCENVKPGTFQLDPDPADNGCHEVQVEAGVTTTVTVESQDYAFLNDVVLVFEGETAWAADGNEPGEQPYNEDGRGNWATYVAYEGEEKTTTLFAGQTIDVGTVTFSAPLNDDIEITVELTGDWEFADVSENLKIQDYDEAPEGNPSPGQFDHKFDCDADESTCTVPVPLNDFYGVHVEVGQWVPHPDLGS